MAVSRKISRFFNFRFRHRLNLQRINDRLCPVHFQYINNSAVKEILFMKKSLLLFVLSLFFAFSASTFAVETKKPEGKQLSPKELETITKLASTLISKSHYRQHPLDDSIAASLFDEYFKTLDPNKIYFSKEDISKFEKYKDKLDDQLLSGKAEFAFELYKYFLSKLDQYQAYTTALLDKGFDFTENETFQINRSKEDWAANEAALKELWRKKTKNEVLTLRLIEKAAKEDKNKDDKNKEGEQQPHPSWTVKTPEERVKKRTTQLIEFFKKNESVDILELYLSSLARIYDPHSAYMAPRTEEDFNIQMRLSLKGIGAILSADDGYTKIVKIIQGGPAERDGRLKEEDRIIAVAQDGGEPVDVIDMPLSKVVDMIRGPENTSVHLTVLDGAKGINAIPSVISIKRDTVLLKEQEASGKTKEIKTKDGKTLKIGILTLPSFYMDFDEASKGKEDYKSSTRDVQNILQKFNQEKIDGLVMDLRSNGGGSLPEAIKLSGLFIKSGPIVQVKSNVVSVENDEDKNMYYDGPMIVLLNRLSASATEIFAGAMKDYQRALLIGDSRTHGKGTVQTVNDLKQFLYWGKFPAGSVKYTTALFYRISGNSTQLKGIEPDIVFPSFTESMEIGEENLDHALPWDQIAAVNHDIYVKNLPELIPALAKRTLARQNENPKFVLLKKDIEAFEKIRKNKTVSLNENIRWSEYQKEKKLHDEQSKLMKIDEDGELQSKVKKKGSKKDKKDEDDLYMDESLNIMNDYINLLDNKPLSDNKDKALQRRSAKK